VIFVACTLMGLLFLAGAVGFLRARRGNTDNEVMRAALAKWLGD